MKYFKSIILLTLCIVGISVFVTTRHLFRRPDLGTPEMKITQSQDGIKNINVCVTLPQIKNEIAPIIIEEFLSQTKIAKADNGGLKLVDFNDNSILAKYGFEKGDIIKEVSGYKLDSINEAIVICEAIEKQVFKDGNAKEIDVALNRRGEDVLMNFNIPAFAPKRISYMMRLEKRARG